MTAFDIGGEPTVFRKPGPPAELQGRIGAPMSEITSDARNNA